MKKILMVVSTSIVILPACPVFADGTFDGQVDATGISTSVNGSEAKFREYRDIRDGLYTNLRLKYGTDIYYMEGRASDIGYDTQKYRLEGGMFGGFKAYIDYSETPHNLTFGARSFYSGIGTNHLTVGATPPALPSTWTEFDYSTKREKVQVGLSVDKLKPFFFEFSAPHEEKTGTYPVSIAMTSPAVETPVPIDYKTNAINVIGGYAKIPFFAAIDFYYSQFENSDHTLYFERPANGVSDAYSLPPDNQAYKIAFKGSAKLPYNSQFSTNLATSKMTADENILLSQTATFGQAFHGEVATNNVDFILTSNPIHLLNAKIYYKYNERRNDSDQLTSNSPGATTFATNTLLGYEKNKFGIDLGWNLPAKFKLDTDYSYMSMNRTPTEFLSEDIIILPETKDNTLSAELKYRGFDFMTPKIGYTWMKRTADHVFNDFDEDPAVDIESYFWRFNVAPKTQNTVKASVDIYPLNNLNFNIGYKYIDVDYSDTILGMTSSRSNQFNFDVGYAIGKIAQINAYYDIELRKSSQLQRKFSGTNSDPSSQTASNYNYDVSLKDNSYSWGVGSEIYILPKTLSFLLQYNSVNSNGNADFTSLFASSIYAAGNSNNSNIDMANWDDYRLSSYSAKIKYSTMSHYTFTVGYAYECYKFNSAQYENYMFVQGTNYMTGAYANPNYDAQIVFAAVEYKF